MLVGEGTGEGDMRLPSTVRNLGGNLYETEIIRFVISTVNTRWYIFMLCADVVYPRILCVNADCLNMFGLKFQLSYDVAREFAGRLLCLLF